MGFIKATKLLENGLQPVLTGLQGVGMRSWSSSGDTRSQGLGVCAAFRGPGSRCGGSHCHCPEVGAQLSDFASRSLTASSVRGNHDPGLRRVARKSSGQGGASSK